MAPPQYPCIQCGGTEFEEIDGRWFCHQGHEQEGGQQVEEDDADYGKGGKISRRKESTEKQKVYKVYRGQRGFQLYLKAWQYILWQQCYAFIHHHGLPTDLWTVVRELWALRLSHLMLQPEDTIMDNENSLSDSSDVLETEVEQDTDGDLKTFKTSKKITDNPSLSETISLIYIGILILHHPTRLSTIYRCIRQEKVCYIRAIRFVPQEIRDHLAPEYHLALDTMVIPTRQSLQLAIYRTATMYGHACSIEIPCLNWTLILNQYIRALALPIEVFTAVKGLLGILDYQFAYPLQHGQRRNATTYPEAQLMSLTVVATKLLYPFDSMSVKRSPQTLNEPAAMRMDWQAWLDSRAKAKGEAKSDELLPEDAIKVTDRDVFEMSNDLLDQYMDWFQQTYIKDASYSKNGHVQKQILDMFPLQDIRASNSTNKINDVDHQQIVQRLKQTQGSLRPHRVAIDEGHSDDETVNIRPGQYYQQYRSLEDMPQPAQHFHEEAAEIACLDIDALLRACLRTERLLLLYQHERKRSEYFKDVA